MPLFPMGTGAPNTSDAKISDEQQPTSITTPTFTQIKNRRKRYLDMHPEYFSADLELADPLLYDRLIRRFQTAAEREAEGREKGFSGVLQADLLRSEAKFEALSHPDPHAMFSYTRGPNGEILAEDRDEIPADKEEGEKTWRWEMTLRFLRGEDMDFDYTVVDTNDDYDDLSEEQERYFEDEEPEWIVEGLEGERGAAHDDDNIRSRLQGETGIQDF